MSGYFAGRHCWGVLMKMLPSECYLTNPEKCLHAREQEAWPPDFHLAPYSDVTYYRRAPPSMVMKSKIHVLLWQIVGWKEQMSHTSLFDDSHKHINSPRALSPREHYFGRSLLIEMFMKTWLGQCDRHFNGRKAPNSGDCWKVLFQKGIYKWWSSIHRTLVGTGVKRGTNDGHWTP